MKSDGGETQKRSTKLNAGPCQSNHYHGDRAWRSHAIKAHSAGGLQMHEMAPAPSIECRSDHLQPGQGSKLRRSR